MRGSWQDLRYGVRMLAKTPGFTAIAVLALAIGIGANSAIFTVVNAVLLKPLAYRDAERLVMVWEKNAQLGVLGVSGANFIPWRDQTRSFQSIALFGGADMNLTGGEHPERLQGSAVTSDFFDVVGFNPELGRGFRKGEDTQGAPKVAVLSYGLWMRRYGSDRNILGRAVTINGEGHAVVGVMARQMKNEAELWVPFALDPSAAGRGGHSFNVIARLKPNVSIEQAQGELDVLMKNLERQYPESNRGYGALVVPLKEQVVSGIRKTLRVLLGAVGFVLLIACGNVANLQLSRATARQREVAVRLALGAGRGRIIRQLLTENAMLALMGGGLGLLLAIWGVDMLVALSAGNIPRLEEVSVDWRVVGFTLLISLATGIVFGLFPALQATRADLSEKLKDGAAGLGAATTRNRLRSTLVVAEIALSLVLLIGAGLMIRNFLQLQRVDPGFNPENVLTMRIPLPEAGYRDFPRRVDFYRQVIARAGSLPGVQSVATTHALPLSGMDSGRPFAIAGSPPPEVGKEPNAAYRVISPNYFSTMGIPILSGRDFSGRDTDKAPGVAMINQTMARRFWRGESPVGRQIRQLNRGPWLTIVGIAGDVRHSGLDQDAKPEMYFPYSQVSMQNSPSIDGNSRRITLVVRTRSKPALLADAIRKEVLAVDKDQPVVGIRTMEDYLSLSLASQRFNMVLLGIFAFIALALAAVGVYGVMSYLVSQRTREIGIRMALGAQRRHVLRSVMAHSIMLTGIGVVAGITAALALTRVLGTLLHGVSATDPLTFVLISGTLILVALGAGYLPARRATRVDPVIALRYE